MSPSCSLRYRMIYLDNNSTTKIDPAVLAEVMPILNGPPSNPSSVHRLGQEARARVAGATKQIAAHFGVKTKEVVFTSGATEALNVVIRSVPSGLHIITSSLEHIAVLEAVKLTGCTVTYLDPEPGKGAITAAQIAAALQPNTAMIVVMAANNETGVKTDLEPIAALAEEKRIALVVDGVAQVGKEPFTLYPGISALCLSGHKIHAPQGIGVAIIRSRFPARPLIVGGPQQRGVRGGTENVAGIVGLAKALEFTTDVAHLRDRLEAGLRSKLSDVVVHGENAPRVGNVSNMAFPGVEGEWLLMQLDLAGIAVSHGAACSSGALEPSRVLLNMGIAPKLARSSIRFSLSRFTTEAEIDRTIETVVKLTSQAS